MIIDGALLLSTFVGPDGERGALVVMHRCIRCQRVVSTEDLDRHREAHRRLLKSLSDEVDRLASGMRYLTIAGDGWVVSICPVCHAPIEDGDEELVEHTCAHMAVGDVEVPA